LSTSQSIFRLFWVVLRIIANDFEELYIWLKNNHNKELCVWVNAKRGKPNNYDFNYIDAVYCALCFGWIDTTCKNIDGVAYQKFVPRRKKSHWTYLNIARCEYLMEQGFMTKSGQNAMLAYHNLIQCTQA